RIDGVSLTGQHPVEEVARIKLNARLRREDLHHPAARGLVYSRREHGGPPLFGAILVEHEVVILPATVTELLVVLADPSAYRGWGTEVERRPCHAADLPRGDQGGVD